MREIRFEFCIENWDSVGTTKRVVTLFAPKCHTKQCHTLASVEFRHALFFSCVNSFLVFYGFNSISTPYFY